jgi:PAS domain S-box-containing protein
MCFFVMFLLHKRLGNVLNFQEADCSPEETIVRLRAEVAGLQEIEGKLRKSETSLKVAEQMARLGHWEFNIPRDELHWSDEIYRIFEIDSEKIQASYAVFMETIHPEDRGKVARAYQDSLDNKTPYDIVHRLQLSRGEIKYVHEVCQTTYDSNGDPLVSMGTVQDVTEKILHDEIVEQKHKLDSLGILASSIANDFNNTLVGILGNLDLVLARTDSSDPIYSFIEESKESALKARSFSKGLMTFAKGDNPVCGPVDLGSVLHETVNSITLDTGVVVEWNIPDNLWLAHVDSGQISQVFQNLTMNSVEAMPDGGIIKISLINRKVGDSVIFKDEGITVRFQDSGPGIEDENAASVFDPYFTKKKDANGLGLAVVESIMTKHGGQVYLDRDGGKSSLFVLNIPAKKSIVPAISDGLKKAVKALRILVLDDELPVLEVLGLMLENGGHNVDLVADCEDAMAAFTARLNTDQPYDLVITDLTMPCDCDGHDILQKIVERSPLAKVILASGHLEHEAVENYLELGFKAVLAKPFGFDEIQAAINEAMGSD